MEARTHRLVVPKTARYVTSGPIEGDLEEVWFLCHGYSQLAAHFLGLARALEHPKRLLVAPEALSRFYLEDHRAIGGSWMTREDREHEIEDYVRYFDLLHEQVFTLADRARVRVIVMGFSQGAATAARWATRGRMRPDRLILWGAALPPELDDESALAALASVRLTLVSGSRDALFPEGTRDEQRDRLRHHKIPFSELEFNGGHRLDDDTLRRLARES